MKKYLLFFITLLIISGATRADAAKYNVNDSLKLLSFLKEKAIQELVTDDQTEFPVDNTLTNAQLLLAQFYSPEWQKDPNWINKISLNMISWTDNETNKRIKHISIAQNYFQNAYLSGNLDLRGCDSLAFVEITHQKLTSVNLTECKKLEEVHLQFNSLLPSKITMPQQYSGQLNLDRQEFDYDYSAEVINGELYIKFDFNKEKSAGIDRKSTRLNSSH